MYSEIVIVVQLYYTGELELQSDIFSNSYLSLQTIYGSDQMEICDSQLQKQSTYDLNWWLEPNDTKLSVTWHFHVIFLKPWNSVAVVEISPNSSIKQWLIKLLEFFLKLWNYCDFCCCEVWHIANKHCYRNVFAGTGAINIRWLYIAELSNVASVPAKWLWFRFRCQYYTTYQYYMVPLFIDASLNYIGDISCIRFNN